MNKGAAECMDAKLKLSHGHQARAPLEYTDPTPQLSHEHQAQTPGECIDEAPKFSHGHQTRAPLEYTEATQQRLCALKRWQEHSTEENLWAVVLAYAGVQFKTYSGLPFTYQVRKGRNGNYTKELWIDRREKSKSLAWSSVLLALRNIEHMGRVVDRPKALGDIRGITYIYAMFYRFGLIDVPDKAKATMEE